MPFQVNEIFIFIILIDRQICIDRQLYIYICILFRGRKQRDWAVAETSVHSGNRSLSSLGLRISIYKMPRIDSTSCHILVALTTSSLLRSPPWHPLQQPSVATSRDIYYEFRGLWQVLGWLVIIVNREMMNPSFEEGR